MCRSGMSKNAARKCARKEARRATGTRATYAAVSDTPQLPNEAGANLLIASSLTGTNAVKLIRVSCCLLNQLRNGKTVDLPHASTNTQDTTIARICTAATRCF